MSVITSLPLIRVLAGVQTNEDWNPSFAIFALDGVTPVNVSTVTFIVTLTSATGTVIYTSQAGDVTISGTGFNIVTINVPAARKAGWLIGVYQFNILATDGASYRDILGASTLTVGNPQQMNVFPLGSNNSGVILGGITIGYTPAQFLAVLSTLSPAQFIALAQTILNALPVMTTGGAVPATGTFFLTDSNIVGRAT